MTPSEFLTQLGNAIKDSGSITSYEIGQQTLVGSINFYSLAIVLPSGKSIEVRCSHELSKDVLTFADGASAGLKIDLHETSRGLGVIPAVAIGIVLEQFLTQLA